MKARTVEPLAPEIVDAIEAARGRERPESQLIAVLQKVQGRYGYLAREHMDEVSQRMQIPAARVTGVASFYHFFSFAPKGKNRITVCMGTACFVRGAAKVRDRIRDLLGIAEGGVTRDGRFSLDPARCLGACALGPVVVVNDRVYGNVTPDDVPRILSEYGFGKDEA